MRLASLALLALVIGCASTSRPPKPSPCHYGAAVNPHRAVTQKLSHGR
jgi:hypothetical protein